MTERTTEVRSLRGVVEARAGGERRIGGFALKYGTRSQNLGGFVETIDPRFLAKSEGDGWPGVMARWNHEDAFLLGTTAAATLRLDNSLEGLDYEVDVPAARADVYELVQRGDVNRSSFAFVTFEDDWGLTEDGFALRTLLSGRLVDVAPVNTPAYLDTSTGLRSLAERVGAEEAEVRSLAEAGALSRLLCPTPVVVDLGEHRAETGAPDPAPESQAPATAPVRIQLMRRELELKKPR
jgi:hypothetical protein